MPKRSSNFELLRIVSMVLIIGHHFAVHGGFYFTGHSVTGNMLFLQLLNVGGKIGVNLFVLISGYFLVTARGIRGDRVWKLWLQIFISSLLLYTFSCLSGLADFSLTGLVKAAVPILSRQWWFASAYFFLYLLHPVLNRFLASRSRKAYRWILAGLALLWWGFPVLTWLPERLRDLAWFATLYALAGYLRLHTSETNSKKWLAWGTAAFVLTFLYGVVQLVFMARTLPRYETAYFQMYALPVLLTSVLLFRGFAGLELGYNARINSLAALSFGIYLIHDSDYLRYPLWQGLFHCAAFRDHPLLIPYALFAMAAVYLVCGLLEHIRQRILAKPFTALSKRICK